MYNDKIAVFLNSLFLGCPVIAIGENRMISKLNFSKLLDELDKTENDEGSVSIARLMVRSFPDEPDSWRTLYWNIGLMLLKAKRKRNKFGKPEEKLVNEMIDAWGHYIKLAPHDSNCCWNMAGFLKEFGRYSEAAEAYLKAAVLEKKYGGELPGDDDMYTGFEYYHAAECYRLVENYKKALDAIEKAIEQYELPGFWELKGKIFEQKGDAPAAEVAYFRARLLAEKEM